MEIVEAIRKGQVKVTGRLVVGGKSRRTEDGTAFTTVPVAARRAKRRAAGKRAKQARRRGR
jgi:hypothetical protein